MSKFYRNRRGFLASLTKGGGLWIGLGATGLILLCVGVLLWMPEQEPNQEVLVPSDTAVVAPVTDSQSDSASSDSSADLPEDTDTVEPEEPAGDVMMTVPVQGTAGTGFSLTTPVFSETMNDWRVHQGIDYKTEGPVQVVAAADGIVEQVYTCELMGLTVEIRHADDTISVYQSLSGEAEVIAGQEVRQGDVIGKTGSSADCEVLEGDHLHFALIRDGVYLNPQERFS